MRVVATALALLLCFAAQASERILSFHSEIRVQADGWIEVTETIRVNAEGDRIRRGIYRDQYSNYRDHRGNRFIADIKPQAVLRNDQPEAWHSIDIDRGIRTYFGHRDRYITPGEHTYQYRYRANRMLGYFEEHDELYWTVTGFDWAFPIDQATARVTLEFADTADTVEFEAYTGRYGARGRDYAARLEAPGVVFFEANRPLSPVNGLTIVVSWPKGLVAEPSGTQKFFWLLRDNANLLVALAGLLALLAYYLPIWSRYGKDPEPGVIVTRYEPPAGYSPASLRYIRRMGYDNKTMTAAIVNLAVKGYLRIVNNDKEHVLFKEDPGPDAPELAPGERQLYNQLFDGSGRTELKNENHARLGLARSMHVGSLEVDYNYTYFKRNGLLNVPGILLAIATAVIALNVADGPTPFVLAALVINFLVVALFAMIMGAPTARGRLILDELLGFKEYLEIAEKEELNLRNPPEKTPELFERYLPYALALGVDQQWAEKFAGVLAAASAADGGDYSPAWYAGSWSNSSLASTASGLTSGLNSSISSSVTPPGSSSGGGGGGFSGGGGGGGGGGGW